MFMCCEGLWFLFCFSVSIYLCVDLRESEGLFLGFFFGRKSKSFKGFCVWYFIGDFKVSEEAVARCPNGVCSRR